MSSSTVSAALAGKAAAAVAGLAYLNARFSIGQDLNFLLGRRAAFAALTKTGEGLRATHGLPPPAPLSDALGKENNPTTEIFPFPVPSIGLG